MNEDHAELADGEDNRPDPFEVFAAAGAATGPGAAAAEVPLPLQALMASGANPLAAAAAPLLLAAPRIRACVRHPDPAALKRALAEGLRGFEAQARATGLPHEQVIAARYILCTLLDESAASTPWGGAGDWSASSLLVQFHNETWGGEKVFRLMARLSEDVGANRPLLELLYIVLALGFEGRYRVLANGQTQLASLRERLFQLLGAERPGDERALSPHWRGERQPPVRLRTGAPLWLLACVSLVLLGVVLATLRVLLLTRAEATFATLSNLDVRDASAVAPPPAPAAPAVARPAPRLAEFLAPEVGAGMVRVEDLSDRSVVSIVGDGFFEPGGARVAPAVARLLPRIAQALVDTDGQLLVAGYTDDSPIRRAGYASNLALSQARAEAVRAELARTLAPARLRAEGRGAREPVAGNDTKAGRARNRRVEITLFAEPARAGHE